MFVCLIVNLTAAPPTMPKSELSEYRTAIAMITQKQIDALGPKSGETSSVH